MNRRQFITITAVAGLIMAMTGSSYAAGALQEKPNVILIMTDDQGYGDLSTHGNPFLKTPNLDKLASQGVRLDDYHVSPYCIPTRAALMTGRYADRTGVHNVIEPHWFVRTNEVLLSDMFKGAGYATGMFGKWHLGDNYPYGAEHRGFDEVLRHFGGAIGVLADYWDNCYVDDTYRHNGKPTKVEGYCTDVFFEAAKQFIGRSAREDKPFFVYLPTNAPHGPDICPPSYSAPYEEGETKAAARFYGMIASIDENVGKLREFLRSKGLEENTIFIFATDNGTFTGRKLFNAGMRGHKGSPYDGGHRVPFFLHWPAGGYTTERRIRTLTAHIDIAPTLLDLCGIPKPKGVKFDGVSLRPLLEKGDGTDWPDRIVMTDSQGRGAPKKWATTAVMTERWRLVEGKELYDIDADPGQETNVYAEYPKVVDRLTAYYDGLWAEIEPTLRDVAEIPLGHAQAPSVALNYHDCIHRHMFWYQNDIRKLGTKIDPPESKRPPAIWPVDVVGDGEYTIELRRWPKELNAAIYADVPPGKNVYGSPAKRTTPGVGFPAVRAHLTIGGQRMTDTVSKDDAGVTFRVKLSKGSQRLSAKFVDADGRSLDTFFVYVTRESPVAFGARPPVDIQHYFDAQQPNEFQFAEIEARYVRIQIRFGALTQPNIDELEVFSPGSQKNLALQSEGAKATASSYLKGYDIYQIEHLNDGQYGNKRSWISDALTGWVQIELPRAMKVDRVVLSRDRDGVRHDRLLDSFDILVSTDGEEWETVKRVRPLVEEEPTEKSPASNPFACHSPAALGRALNDLTTAAPDRFPDAAELRRQVDEWTAAWPALMEKVAKGDAEAKAEAENFTQLQREILLRNPLLDFEQLLLVRRREEKEASGGQRGVELGLPINYTGNCALPRTGYDNEIALLDSIRPGGKITTLYKPSKLVFVGDVDLHWDGEKLLFSSIGSEDRWHLFEIGLDGKGLRQVTPGGQADYDNYDGCYLPDGQIIFGSTASMAGVPCHYGQTRVANLYLMNPDGTGIRQLGFDQDHNWCPQVLHDGRILYLRWEYADLPHSNSRILFTMNPDGTNQREYYGSNSYWPNSIFFARPIPGERSKVAGIVTGHHGDHRMGELVIFDPELGRREADGVVQRIPGYGKKVEPVIADNLVDNSWPKFLHPYPLSVKYFLVSAKPTPQSLWGIYLVDVFDNMLLLAEQPGQVLFEPVVVRKTPRPPVIPTKVDLNRKDAVVNLTNIYQGPGLAGVPPGTVKKLRVFTYHYTYPGFGGLLA